MRLSVRTALARLSARVLLGLVMLAAPARAQGRYDGLDGMTGMERKQVEVLVDETLKGGKSNQTVTRIIAPDVTAHLTPGFFTSAATGQVCDRCVDFCRPYTLELSIDTGFVAVVYEGERCIITSSRLPSDGPWRDQRPPKVIRTRWAVPRDAFDEARDYLGRLGYLPARGEPSAREVMRALEDFRTDAQLSTATMFAITEVDRAALRETATRSAGAGNCARSAAYSACGRMN